MKFKNYIYTLIAGATLLASCKKDFLVDAPSSAVPVATSIKTESDMMDATAGMYAAAKPYTFLGRDIPVLGDLLADNVYVSITNAGRYLSENNYSFIATNGEADDIWSEGYYTIQQSNRIILAAHTLAQTANVQELEGEAYAMRALTNLEMVNFFGPAYTVNASAPGIPIITSSTFLTGPFIKPARNTVNDVYTKIISDLDSAYSIMPATYAGTLHAINANFLSKYGVRAIESRAYLYKGDYANAEKAALDVIQNGGYSLTTKQADFAAFWGNTGPTGKVESIFSLSNTITNNNGTNGLDYMYDQNGYGDLLCTDQLYNLYSATDYRKSLIVNGKRGGVQAYIVAKFTSITNTKKDDVPVIRYAEVLLTAAEAYAQTGDNVNALLYVNMVAQARDPLFTGYTDTGAALISDILTERRKELAFEGLRWFDLKRTNQVINRPAEPYAYPSYPTVSITDIRRLLPIPQSELAANPNMTQNPGY